MEKQKKRPIKRRKPSGGLSVNILMLIVIALIVFEGKSLLQLFSKNSYAENIKTEVDQVLAQVRKEEAALTEKPTEDPKKQSETQTPSTQPETASSNSKPAGTDVIVPEVSPAMDDSYFKDAVFIGDSRMEGFRNQSGITQGDFLTAVGMTLEDIYDVPYISTAESSVTVFDALKKTPYKKVYVMIGTNELGTYDFEELKNLYTKVLGDIRTIQPNAVIYVCSVICVEESLTEFDYVNNENVEKINDMLLDICKTEHYYYLDLNEVLSQNGSLIPGSSADGVHLEAEYLQVWLNYLKNHYIPEAKEDQSGTQKQSNSFVSPQSNESGQESDEVQTKAETETQSAP